MYIIAYFNLFIDIPILWAFFLITFMLILITVFKLRGEGILFGSPLILLAVIAAFFPVDTFICIDRETISGDCTQELSTGIIILAGIAYFLSITIWYLNKPLIMEQD